MSITVAEVLAAVQTNMPQAGSLTTTTIQRPLRAALKAISAARNALYAIDSLQALAEDDETLDYPTNFKALDYIVLKDSASNMGKPLILKPYEWYLKRKEDDTSTDEPKYYSEVNRKFYLYHASDGVYTAYIHHWRHHPEDVTSILFPDEYREAIYALTTWQEASFRGRSRYMQIWGGGTLAEALANALNFMQVPDEAVVVEFRDV